MGTTKMVLLASERTYDYLYWLPLLKLSREPFRKNYEKLEINKPAATEKVLLVLWLFQVLMLLNGLTSKGLTDQNMTSERSSSLMRVFMYVPCILLSALTFLHEFIVPDRFIVKILTL